MVLLDLLCYLSAATAGIIGVLKNTHMLRDKEAVDTMMEDYRIKSPFRFLFVPTFYGWLFIECVLLAMVLFMVKDTISKAELQSWEEKIVALTTNVTKQAKTPKNIDTIVIRTSTLTAADTIKKADTIALRQLVLRTPKDSMTAEQKQGAFITLYANDITDTTRGDDIKLTLILMNDGLGTAQDVKVAVQGIYEFDTHSYVNMKVGRAAKSIMKSADTTLARCHFSKRKIKLNHLSLYCKISYITNGKEVNRTVLLSYNDALKWAYKGEQQMILNHLRANEAF